MSDFSMSIKWPPSMGIANMHFRSSEMGLSSTIFSGNEVGVDVQPPGHGFTIIIFERFGRID
jgi:hypothetical protein